MGKHTWLVVTLLVGGVLAMILFLWPLWQTETQSDTEAPLAPAFGSTVRVENPRIVLPGSGGDAAMVYFDVTNTGAQTVQLTEVRFAHGDATGMQNTEGPAWTPVATLDIAPGETLSFNSEDRFAVLSDYDSDVVPGAMIDVTLVFGTSATVTVPARVHSARSTVETGGASAGADAR